MRKLTYFVGTTVDGFIAGPEDQVDHYVVSPEVVGFLSTEYPETLPTHVRSALGVDAPGTRFDTVVMGRRTYQPGLDAGFTSPYGHLRQYVASSEAESPDPAVTFTADPLATVRALKAEDGAGIWLAGGSGLAGALLSEIDELVVKVYPVVSGTGVPLLSAAFRPSVLRLTGNRQLGDGTVVLSYALR
ncbi:deaminase [Longispora fulva]|uniref:Dihydrofolate reductase n=1 Tax=Longispora fulva TaxID=619741 RepID=A0A8J7GGZ2_9ACTN|nr:dihydrofolate reductase family protein [Longispora fulva]MBG6136880.1 dihydrofolate reductase [Longispora fulva]GIG60051.1 deaminase [Longispora fulva]